MTADIFTADSVCRSFGTKQALHNVSLSIARGTVCSLLGPNGAGKTTLLKLFLGIIQPTAGGCSVLGDGNLPRGQVVLQSLGCLIDGFDPPGGTRIGHLLSLNREIGPMFDQPRAVTMLREKQLHPNTIWRSISKGQKRWALLVMLLCRGCEALLLDEPADGLDPEARRQLYQLIRREANQRGVTALVTTHIVNDIEKVTDDVCILHQGRVILHESLEDLREQVVVVEVEDPVEVPDGAAVLRTEAGDPTTLWIRDITGSLDGATLPGEVSRRKVGLEEVYLALTREANERMASTQSESNRLDTTPARTKQGK